MGRPLENAKIIQALLKSGVVILGKDALEVRKASLKKVVLMMERQGGPAGDAKDFTRCMAFLREEARTGDTLSGHNISSMDNPHD